MSISFVPTDADAAHTMRQRGNDFLKKLAECWLTASMLDQVRIRRAFQAEFEQARQLARLLAINEQAKIEAAAAFDAHVANPIAMKKSMEQHVADGQGRN